MRMKNGKIFSVRIFYDEEVDDDADDDDDAVDVS